MARVEPCSGEIHQTCIGSQCLGGRHTHSSVALVSSALSSFLSSSKNGTREKTVIRQLMLLLF